MASLQVSELRPSPGVPRRNRVVPFGGPAGEGSQAAKGSVEVFAALGWLALFSHRSLKMSRIMEGRDSETS